VNDLNMTLRLNLWSVGWSKAFQTNIARVENRFSWNSRLQLISLSTSPFFRNTGYKSLRTSISMLIAKPVVFAIKYRIKKHWVRWHVAKNFEREIFATFLQMSFEGVIFKSDLTRYTSAALLLPITVKEYFLELSLLNRDNDRPVCLFVIDFKNQQ
jgi:hypothetical protein